MNDLALLAPPLLAGLLILTTHVPLGREVLARGIVFIDLAIAQIAALGMLAAHVLLPEPAAPLTQAAATGAALAGALLLTWSERRWPEVQEAHIGVAFVLASCLGLLLLGGDPHGGEHLHDLLAGQILWVTWEQIGWLAGVTALLAAWQRFLPPRRGLGFYALFALAVTASVQVAGVYLVFASLIVPALACRGLAGKAALGRGYALGAAGYVLGLAASAQWDLPAGAVIVCALVLAGLAARRLP